MYSLSSSGHQGLRGILKIVLSLSDAGSAGPVCLFMSQTVSRASYIAAREVPLKIETEGPPLPCLSGNALWVGDLFYATF